MVRKRLKGETLHKPYVRV